MRWLIAAFALVLLNVYSSNAQSQGGFPMSYGFDDKLSGPVRTIRVENAQVLKAGNKYVESSRALLQEVTYNAQGQKTIEVNYNGDRTISVKNVFGYSAEGQLKEIVEYKPNGSLLRRKVYTHNDHTIEEVTYKADGTLNSDKLVNTFDDSGRQISVASFGAEGAPFVEAVITYRNDGKVVEVATCASSINGGMLAPSRGGRMVVLSDATKDKMKGVPPCLDSHLTSRTVFTLDDAGHIAEVTIYTPDNSLIEKQSYAHEFDSRGNWIKETKSRFNAKTSTLEPVEIRYREITYY